MDQLNDLEVRAEELISELSDILQNLQHVIGNEKKSISFDQVKEIENSITRMKKQGIPVPAELRAVKIKLFSEYERHQGHVALCRKIKDSLSSLLEQEVSRIPRNIHDVLPNVGGFPHRKPSNYTRPLGSRGYNNLEHYLIPVIRLMWSGLDHKEAFHKIAQRLDVRYNTVASQCTRTLNLTTDEFINQVNSKKIVGVLEQKYPDQCQKIGAELMT